MLLTISALAGLLGSIVLGQVSDRMNPVRLYRILLVVQCGGLAVYLLTRNYWILGSAMTVVAMADRGTAAARGPMIAGFSKGVERVRYRAALRSISNGGTAIGAAFAAIPLAMGTYESYAAVILLNAITYVVAAMMLHGVTAGPVQPERARSGAGESVIAVRDVPFLLVTVANAVLYLHDGLLTIALPIWVVSQIGNLGYLVSVIVIVNTIGVILLQVRFAQGVESIRDASKAGCRSGLSLALACVLLAVSAVVPHVPAIALVIGASLLHLCGELWQSASSWAFGFEMTDDAHLGQYQGLLNAGTDVGSILSPTVLIAVANSNGAANGWWALAVLFAVTALLYGPLGSYADRTRVIHDR